MSNGARIPGSGVEVACGSSWFARTQMCSETAQAAATGVVAQLDIFWNAVSLQLRVRHNV